jgi:hypothetical protein
VTAAQAQVAGFPFAGVHKVDLGQEAEVKGGWQMRQPVTAASAFS